MVLFLPLLFLNFFYYTYNTDIIIIVSSSGKSLYLKDLPLIIIGKVFKKKVILNFVGGMAIDSKIKWRWYKKLPFQLSSSVVLPSNTFKEYLSKKIKNINYYVIPHIVDVKLFANDDLKIIPDEPILISVKEMKDYGGHIHLLYIFKEIQKNIQNAKLWLIGKGPERKNIEECITRLKLNNVKIFDSMLKQDLSTLIKRADIFLHGTKYESFGIVLVEAMAAGLPVVSFNVGGISDVVINKENGFLVDYLDNKNFEKKLLKLINDETIYYRMQKHCILRATSFKWENIGQKWYDICKL